MQNFNTNNKIPFETTQNLPIFEKNPKLKNLLLVLMVVLLFSGMGLAFFSYQQKIYREKLYYETEGGLPIHKSKKTDASSTWKSYKDEIYGFEFNYPGFFIEYEDKNSSSLIDLSTIEGADSISVMVERRSINGYKIYDVPSGIAWVYTQKSNGEGSWIDQEDPKRTEYNPKTYKTQSGLVTYITSTGDGPWSGQIAYVPYIGNDGAEFILRIAMGWATVCKDKAKNFDECKEAYEPKTGPKTLEEILSTLKFTK